MIIVQVKDANLIVQDSMGNKVETQYVEFDNVTKNLRKFYAEAYLGRPPEEEPKYWLIFQASVPPLGWNTYFFSVSTGKGIYLQHISGQVLIMSYSCIVVISCAGRNQTFNIFV